MDVASESIGGKIIITTLYAGTRRERDREGATLQISFGTVNY
jgi:hypothetical protein